MYTSGFNFGNKKSYSSTENRFQDIEQKFISGRVVNVILSEDNSYGGWSGIGTIEVEDLSSINNSSENIISALPLFSNIKNYPLIDEIVFLIKLPDNKLSTYNVKERYYYLSSINIWNTIHHNAYPDILRDSTARLGEFVEERDNIKPLLPFQGDIIFEGRFGNSIRLGSTSPTNTNIWSSEGEINSPITIIRNGQDPELKNEGFEPIVEDLNKDLSSLILTSTQKIPFNDVVENYNALKNSPISLTQFIDPQIIARSNRIVINSSKDDIILNSKQNIAISSIQEIGIESKDVTIHGENINLGNNQAEDYVLLGSSFLEDFSTLLSGLESLCNQLENHQDYPGGAPTPNVPLNLAASMLNETVKSLKNKIKDDKKPLLSKSTKVI